LKRSEHKFNMKYDYDYRKDFYLNEIAEINEDLKEFYEFSADQISEGRPPVWRITVYGLNKISQKEKKLAWLKKMVEGKKTGKQYITDHMIEAAKDYPIEKLAGDVGKNGMKICPFHEDKSPSMYVKNGYAYCFGCGRSWDSIAWIMDRDGLDFISAVKHLNTA